MLDGEFVSIWSSDVCSHTFMGIGWKELEKHHYLLQYIVRTYSSKGTIPFCILIVQHVSHSSRWRTGSHMSIKKTKTKYQQWNMPSHACMFKLIHFRWHLPGHFQCIFFYWAEIILLPVFVCVGIARTNIAKIYNFIRTYYAKIAWSSILPFNFRSVSMPPKLTNEIFHSNSKTFFIGKCGAVPPQNRVIIFNNFTASNSSPIGASASCKQNK